MPIIHFLNVHEGDCSIVEHTSGNTTVIDVCNARPPEPLVEAKLVGLAKAERGVNGNFQQKRYPVNPLSYMRDRGIGEVFRYIQTHPDMDHMDGIRHLFAAHPPLNFWDTANTKTMLQAGWAGSPYDREDWEFYRRLRDSNPTEDPKRLTLLSGSRGQFYNEAADGSGGGDGLYVLAPTPALVRAGNEAAEDFHRCSYVILYVAGPHRILFGGDSHDDSWKHILEQHEAAVTNIDLLIAPHHGRHSGRSYEFLDVLNPTLTFFGNAKSEHLGYDAWRRRGLSVVTNNQANCMVVDAGTSPMTLYVTHGNFAQRVNPFAFFDPAFGAWRVGPITSHLLPT